MVNAGESIKDKFKRDSIFPLYWHNVKASGLDKVIIQLRCRSNDILPLLKPSSFDFVFIDGSHGYSDSINDLQQVSSLIKESGIICGDDLEMQYDEVDLNTAEGKRERDFVTDPRTGRGYHQGVCLGVYHFFGKRIYCRDGF